MTMPIDELKAELKHMTRQFGLSLRGRPTRSTRVDHALLKTAVEGSGYQAPCRRHVRRFSLHNIHCRVIVSHQRQGPARQGHRFPGGPDQCHGQRLAPVCSGLPGRTEDRTQPRPMAVTRGPKLEAAKRTLPVRYCSRSSVQVTRRLSIMCVTQSCTCFSRVACAPFQSRLSAQSSRRRCSPAATLPR